MEHIWGFAMIGGVVLGTIHVIKDWLKDRNKPRRNALRKNGTAGSYNDPKGS